MLVFGSNMSIERATLREDPPVTLSRSEGEHNSIRQYVNLLDYRLERTNTRIFPANDLHSDCNQLCQYSCDKDAYWCSTYPYLGCTLVARVILLLFASFKDLQLSLAR